MAKEKTLGEADQTAADQTAAEQAAADQAAADQAAADQAAADQAIQVEVVLLRDSNLGTAGDIVSVSATDAETYKQHGMIDDHAEAIAYAKSNKSK
jgi:hypothetical protein